ncbi:hypothetical protein LXA43DRAFT_164138 [Ganoderma leucocontextum]|nr:hypothetical protein LXA43DRAFT_164138 [Ganoderma leucocontextum]
MSMNQYRALGQPRGNPGPRTPLPSANVVDESQLTYKPSRGPWVQLLFSPSDGPFVKGQSVQIYDIVPMYRTPSAGPRPNMPPNDYNTQYRYRRRAKLLTYHIAKTEPINHRNLLPTKPLPNGRPTSHGPAMYRTGPEYVNRETVTFNNMTIDVSKHTGVTLESACSRTRRPLATTTNLESLYYIVQVHFEVQTWMYTNGAEGCNARDLSPVVPEKQAKIDQWVLKSPHYVDASRLAIYLRRNLANYLTEREE